MLTNAVLTRKMHVFDFSFCVVPPVEPIVQGPRDTSGKTSGTLARFTIPKGSQPGDILGFESKNPTKVSVQAFIGQDINRLTFRLVNQHNESITDLAGEHFSAVVVLAYD